VAQSKYNRSSEKPKQVTAKEVYQVTSDTLQEIFQLDLSAGLYEAQDIWYVLIAAAVERVTVVGGPVAQKLLNRARAAAIDVTDIPYHGQHDEQDEHIGGDGPGTAPLTFIVMGRCMCSKTTNATPWPSPWCAVPIRWPMWSNVWWSGAQQWA